MATVALTPGMQVLAFKLQEAGMMQSDVRARLSDAIRDAHAGTGSYGYYVDHSGDAESGDVVYSCNGDLRMCGYELADVNGKSAATVDIENSVSVVPTTTYQEEADEADHYATMEAELKRENLYSTLPVYERFISKAERKAASSDDFAGKGKSFPILKPGDIMAAVHSIGRAGSGNLGASGIKNRIIAIAKRKGWTEYLPKAWRGDATAESARTADTSENRVAVTSGAFGSQQASESDRALQAPLDSTLSAVDKRGTIRLNEGAMTLENIVVREAKADYEIKLIAPGKGSSAFYPKEVLQRDGPNVFKAGTHIYLNHPTPAEEAARPEGDVSNLAGVLATDAVYHESHAKGPGLYARMKVFADHAQTVEEKAPHVGMSIRANGVAESGKKRDGLPILKQLTSAESVDIVTRAGAGGMIFLEAARLNQEHEMTDEQIKQLVESSITSAVNAAVEKIKQPVSALEARAIRGDAMVEANRALSSISLHEAAKQRVIETVLRNVPMKDGALDSAKLQELVIAEAKQEGAYLASVTGAGRVIGMGGAGAPAETDPVKIAEARKRASEEETLLLEAETSAFSDLMGNETAAKLAAKGKAA